MLTTLTALALWSLPSLAAEPVAIGAASAQDLQIELDVASVDIGEPSMLGVGGRVSVLPPTFPIGFDTSGYIGYFDKDELVGGRELPPSAGGELTVNVALFRRVAIGETQVPIRRQTRGPFGNTLEVETWKQTFVVPVRHQVSLRAGGQGHQAGLPLPRRVLKMAGGHLGVGYRRDRMAHAKAAMGQPIRTLAGTANAYLDLTVLMPVKLEGEFEEDLFPVGARVGGRWRMVRNTGARDRFGATAFIEGGVRPWGTLHGVYLKLGVGGSIGARLAR